ncbi:LacI family DNA-binding transcriptional regulator [Sphaerimonospora thailandensis]|uniref:LacI family transcriptional regulator n=1 Tax=Sphaerimonospora thailandensis TaxID=795644 RepID=A0A8J3VXE8_9ACTN|nr:LacI family DNA-binding transcriptional regulator [Sphaerimonospora thailandensis]GIH68417.1 LacI family transcriptional regulator [Sphaerimonospora thailandensis]
MSATRPTMEDVAARAGVSRALVSIVFRGVAGASPATRERVLAAAADLGYQPDRRASRLGRARTRMIGVVFHLGHAFHGDLVDSLYVAAAESGYELVLSGVTARRPEEEAVRALLGECCEAVVLLGSALPARALAELAARLPTVSVLRDVRADGVDVVRTDDTAGLRAAVAHLHGLGHRRVMHADGGRAPGAAQRRRGYRDAVRRLGLPEPPLLPGGLTEEDGARAADTLLALPPGERPTAVTAFNDRCALGLLDAVRRAGLEVPHMLSVVGFDDIRAASYAHIGLTTIRQDADALGRLAVGRAAARLDEGEPPGRPLVVPPALVVRSTTAPP